MKNEKPPECMRCGRRPTSLKERMNAGDTSYYICVLCYEEMMFPGLSANAMEFLDETKTPSKLSRIQPAPLPSGKTVDDKIEPLCPNM